MKYKIVHKEILVGCFFVEANSKEEALEEYHFLCNDGKIDFSDMEMVDSSDVAEECKKEEYNFA